MTKNTAQRPLHELACCSDCDAVVSFPTLQSEQLAECPRCHHVIKTTDRWSLHRCAMIALSILILMPFALKFPLLSIDLLGTKIDASVWGGVWKMATQGYPYTAFLVFICAVFMPISFALLVLLLRLSQLLRVKPRNLLISLAHIKPWVMFDVYLVALAVTMFKVKEYATLEIDIYLIAFVFTALLTTLLFIKLNPKELWNEFYPQQHSLNSIPQDNKPHYCFECQYSFMHAMHDRQQRAICPRCHSTLHLSAHIKLQRTWATLIAGIIMIFPANLLPISVVYVNGAPSADTLMSGVLSFIDMGSYFVAFIVFVASIFVPISKIMIMLYLLICVHFQLRHSIKWQMRLLHFVHFVGRWSMLDLFVLALMMSLVTRGQIIDFSVGPAAFYFGIAVFLTMISTSQFDSRLLWKIYDKQTAR
ncbi:paraquat-inducible protein A [Pasteurella multocida]|uniref:Paraquat-inducible protein A n=1 Tax=Pasteurella multocida TaxID=747 RepID=A0AAW8V6U0_PASMD|nr:paraquat-inducible protein A [Pasteurella multocida]MDH7437720.1 paraquat-inducible protein A [Pasteurella multocida]MDH7440625.1 paraquat-inducible protein A [Pasteurella multocida]MDT3452263.1 paraquat-inducible protein A [Pasteurella multocida]MDY0432990.1 paraquat-inducible protein A [Pasteurella multocida]MDY0437252.1 paraquat-inducible protein A [Pasteurella multocida]